MQGIRGERRHCPDDVIELERDMSREPERGKKGNFVKKKNQIHKRLALNKLV